MFPLPPSNLFSTIVVVCMMMWLSRAQTWDNAERDLALDIHNDLRASLGGCWINKLVYDKTMEQKAKFWAEQCKFLHGQGDGYGENLSITTSTKDTSTLITQHLNEWAKENQKYTYPSTKCSGCRHYTQMVWWKSEKLGCYMTRCPSIKAGNKEFKNASYLVCLYSPKGNYKNELPYEVVCETPCPADRTEERGLCVKTK